MGGKAWVGGSRQWAGWRYQTAYNNSYGTPLKADSRSISAGGLNAGMSGPLAEWLSLHTQIQNFGGETLYEEKAGPDGAWGTYRERLTYGGTQTDLGFHLFPAAFAGRKFQPGSGNPDGVNLWPSVWGEYYQGSRSYHYTLEEASLGYTGSTQRNELKFRSQGFWVGVDLPVLDSLSLGASHGLETWNQGYDKDRSFSSARPWQAYVVSATLFVLREQGGQPHWNYFPGRGWPGSWRVSASYQWSHWLETGNPGSDYLWASLGYVPHPAVAVSLGASMETEPVYKSDNPSFRFIEAQRSSTGVSLSFIFNLDSRSWNPAPAPAPAPVVEQEPPPAEIPTDPPAEL